jgi:hypothetical protein
MKNFDFEKIYIQMIIGMVGFVMGFAAALIWVLISQD